MSFIRVFFIFLAVVIGVGIAVFLIRSGAADRFLGAALSEGSEALDGQPVPLSGDDAKRLVRGKVEDAVRDEVGDAFGLEGSGFTFSLLGDIESGYETYRDLLGRVNGDGSRFLIVNGDVSERGTAEEFRAYQTFTEKHLDIPYYSTVGNHDILQDGDSSTFSSVLGDRYESFEYGNALFVLLDNGSAARGFDDVQLKWLDSVLSNFSGEHIFLVMHRPFDVPLSAAFLGKDNELKEDNLAAFKAIISQHSVDAIFASHLPGYLEYSVTDANIPLYISGGGGTPSSMSFIASDFHYLRVFVGEKTFRVEKIEL